MDLSPDAQSVKDTIENLIQAGTTSDLKGLDTIYHKDMTIHMIDADGNHMNADKNGFIAMLKDMVANSGDHDNTWAHYDAVEVQDNTSHVLITRKVSLGGENRILVLSIDLVKESGRWQVIREVIFARPNPDVIAA